jgi:hypothetical protein
MPHVILRVDDTIEIDHVNGDGLDNRRENLRVATHAQNASNRGVRVNNTSGFKGVHANHSGRGKQWFAYITTNYKRQHLGMFGTAEEAARAYDAAAVRLHGEFARLNFPSDHAK